MTKTAFEYFPVPERESKPRVRGLSMMVDWGMGLARQQDTVASAGHLIDFAKIAAGIPRFLPEEVLMAKLAHYTANDISTSPGGLFAEAALAMGGFAAFLQEVVRVGFTGVEVSDNLLDISPEDKAAAIRQATSMGLKVFGEVGKKDTLSNNDTFIADVANCLAAGSDFVFLEAVELFVGGEVRRDLIERLIKEFDAGKLIYELPVELLPDATRTYKHRVCADLVREMGTNVNLANVEWDELFQTELARSGFAGDTSHPDGVYARSGVGSH
jgi:phosphosulfolactate synthase